MAGMTLNRPLPGAYGAQAPAPVVQQQVQNQVDNTGFDNKLGNFSKFLNQFGSYLQPSTSSSTSQSQSFGAPAPGYSTSGTPMAGFGNAAVGGTWTPQPVAAAPMPTLPSPQSASSPIFARAKDTVANSLNGLMKAARDNFAGRNLSGGSAEINAMGNILAQGNQQLADTVRQQAITDTGTANDFAKAGYEGALTGRGQDMTSALQQRGQDITAADAARQAMLTARGQDMEQSRASQSLSQSQSENRLSSLLGLMNAFKSLY